MASLDELIGDNVSRMRSGIGMSQRELGSRMKARGWDKWSHLTVAAVERGTRPLRMSEAVDVGEILGGDFRLLTQPEGALAWEQAEIAIGGGQARLEAAVVMYYGTYQEALLEVLNRSPWDEVQDFALLDLLRASPVKIASRVVLDGLFDQTRSLLEDLQAAGQESAALQATLRRFSTLFESWEGDARGERS